MSSPQKSYGENLPGVGPVADIFHRKSRGKVPADPCGIPARREAASGRTLRRDLAAE
jgi:hypothetical protein